MYAIETEALTHRFGSAEPVLRDLALQVPTGGIYGFLGPNGAGKTTTLRLILGLLPRQRGRISVLSESLDANRLSLLRRIGSSIESPSVYAHLTARENLRVWQLVFQCPASRVEAVLAQVGLGDTGGKPAGQFSLGMKQRLSIAVALLHEPSMLILDEPTNGLDPQGIIDIRELLTDLNRNLGTTIIVSSHLLAEVERLVTHVGIINLGQLVFQGPLEALVARQDQMSSTRFDSDDNARALEVIRNGGWVAHLEANKVVVPGLPPAEIGRINHALCQAGLSVHEITRAGTDLESIFIDLIKA